MSTALPMPSMSGTMKTRKPACCGTRLARKASRAAALPWAASGATSRTAMTRRRADRRTIGHTSREWTEGGWSDIELRIIQACDERVEQAAGTAGGSGLSGGLMRVRGDLEPGVQGEFGEHIVHVSLYRVQRDVEPHADLLVAQSFPQQRDDLPFALRHRCRARAGQAPPCRSGCGDRCLGNAERRGRNRDAVGHRSKRPDEVGGRRVRVRAEHRGDRVPEGPAVLYEKERQARFADQSRGTHSRSLPGWTWKNSQRQSSV